MDHRRTQSAQASVYGPPAHPPRVQVSANVGLPPGHSGLLNVNLGVTPAVYRESATYTSSADHFPSSPSADGHSYGHASSSSFASSYSTASLAFPEPHLHRSTSAGAAPRRYSDQNTLSPEHARTFSEESFDRSAYTASVASFSPDRSPTIGEEALQQSYIDQDAIKKFQEGRLVENDQEWHRLVDPEARAALPAKEVKRQAVLFELIKSEKDYVADLQTLQEVFILPLVQARPPIIAQDRIQNFITEVFWNLSGILSHHKRVLEALFERQTRDHPVILTVTDIITEGILAARDDYESYIKHYPLAEARHRREMRRNPAYQEFHSRCTSDKRTRKRDLITFISRPVTRLPRLRLLLETVLKHTEEENPDSKELPFLLEEVLSSFLKSTQPGIAAAESRVKFVSFCENLVFRRGELIDMDLYNEHRTMIHSGPIARKDKNEAGLPSWTDYTAVLLDHYFILTREEVRGEVSRYFVVSRPIPIDFLRLGPFIGPPESRREAQTEGTSGFLNLNNLGLFGESKNMYPFVVFVTGSETRRYTLWAHSERERMKWKQVLEETISIRSAYVDANKLFAFEVLSDDFMREKSVLVSSANRKNITGLMRSAINFSMNGKTYIAVSTETGIYAGYRSDPSVFTKVLDLQKVAIMAALPKYDRLIVLNNGSILSYSLRVFIDVAHRQALPSNLERSLVKLTPKHSGQVNFFRVGRLAGKDMLVYDTRSFRSSTLHSLEIRPDGLKETNKKGAYLPGVATDVQFLSKVLAIVSDRGMTVLDPFNIMNVLTVPDFSDASSSENMSALKSKCDASKTLGIVLVPNGELLCLYEDYGCYITKHGQPTRKCGFVRWEVKAKNFIFRAPHILLFGDNVVEIRDAPTGQFRQMLEHKGIRALEQTSLTGDIGEFLVAWRGEKNDELGQSDALVEVLETRELSPLSARPISLERSTSTASTVTPAPMVDPIWAEWS